MIEITGSSTPAAAALLELAAIDATTHVIAHEFDRLRSSIIVLIHVNLLVITKTHSNGRRSRCDAQ